MAKKQTAPWLVFVQGILLALGVYLVEQLAVAGLLVRGALPEGSAFGAAAVTCALAALAGGVLCVRRSPLGTLPSGLLAAGGFGAVLAAVGLLAWEEGIAWTGRGGVLLLCALAGGLLAGLLGGRRGRRTIKRKRR